MLRTRLGEGSDSAVRRARLCFLSGFSRPPVPAWPASGPWRLRGSCFYVVGALIIARPLFDAARRKASVKPSDVVGGRWSGGWVGAWWRGRCSCARWNCGGGAWAARLVGPVPGGGIRSPGTSGRARLPRAHGSGRRPRRPAPRQRSSTAPVPCRVTVVNAGLLACLLPDRGAVRVGAPDGAGGSGYAGSAARAGHSGLTASTRTGRPAIEPVAGTNRQRSLGSAVAGLSVVALTIAGGVALDQPPSTQAASPAPLPTSRRPHHHRARGGG